MCSPRGTSRGKLNGILAWAQCNSNEPIAIGPLDHFQKQLPAFSTVLLVNTLGHAGLSRANCPDDGTMVQVACHFSILWKRTSVV